MEAEKPKRSTVFISYSHQDAEWLARLRVHLRPLEREDKVEIWDDTKITAGSKWNEEINKALSHTKVAVLLISADFLASDFIAAGELPPLLLAAEEDGARILPLILSPSRFLKTPSLAQFKAVNDPARPLISLSRGEQETVMVKLTEDIEGYLKDAPSRELNTEFHSPHPVPEQMPNTSEGSRRDTFKSRPPAGSPISSEPAMMAKAAKQKPEGHRAFPRITPAVLVAIIGGMTTLTVAYWQFVHNRPDPDAIIKYAGKVINDDETKLPIKGARVSVETQGAPLVRYTDSFGIFSFELPSSTTAARLLVDATDHEPFDRNVTLSKTGLEDIRLTPKPIKYTRKVIDDNGAIKGARVSWMIKGVLQTYTTKSDGLFYLELPSSTNALQVRIEASGHEVFDQTVTVSRADKDDVRIKLLSPKPKGPDGPGRDIDWKKKLREAMQP